MGQEGSRDNKRRKRSTRHYSFKLQKHAPSLSLSCLQMIVQTSQLSVDTVCYQISSNVTKTFYLSLSLYPKIISGRASRKETLAFATNPFSCQAPIGSNVATGCSCSTQGKCDSLKDISSNFNVDILGQCLYIRILESGLIL